MINNKILNICIPTWNRASSLKVCLDNIYDQLIKGEFFNQVDIVISDNGSTDTTEAVVKEYTAKHNNIYYHRNEKNLGFDRNIDCVLTKATGDFCWLMSDDDYFKDGAIDLVLKAIQKHKDVVFFGLCDANQSVGGDYKIFTNGSKCLAEMGIFSGGIPMCIFKREYLPANRAKYYDSDWIHLSMVVEMVAKRTMIMIKHLLKIQPPNVIRLEGNGRVFYVGVGIRKIFKNALNLGYDKNVIDKIVSGLTKNMPRNLASAKLWGFRTSWKDFKILCSQFYDNPLYLIVLIIIFVCPVFILRIIKKIKDRLV